MRINWRNLLDSNNIPYVEHGKNVAKGNINIKCPWCGPNDPSQHLGINLSTGEWGCWRDSTHRGVRPHRLLMKLLGMRAHEVEELIGSVPLPQDSMDRVIHMLAHKGGTSERRGQVNIPKTGLSFPDEIKPIVESLSCKIYLNYLEHRRKFRNPVKVARYYDLHYGLRGDFKNRIVIPITVRGKMVSWTGRHIGNDPIRYKTLSVKSGEALLPSTDTLFEPPSIWEGGEILVITEGPFDAIKLDYVSRISGLPIRATCLYGKTVSHRQIGEIIELSRYFSKITIMLDFGELKSSFVLKDKISAITDCEIVVSNMNDIISSKYGQNAVKDPGDLDHNQAKFLLDFLLY